MERLEIDSLVDFELFPPDDDNEPNAFVEASEVFDDDVDDVERSDESADEHIEDSGMRNPTTRVPESYGRLVDGAHAHFDGHATAAPIAVPTAAPSFKSTMSRPTVSARTSESTTRSVSLDRQNGTAVYGRPTGALNVE